MKPGCFLLLGCSRTDWQEAGALYFVREVGASTSTTGCNRHAKRVSWFLKSISGVSHSQYLHNWCRSTRCRFTRWRSTRWSSTRCRSTRCRSCSSILVELGQVQQPSGAGPGAPSGAVIALVWPALWFSSRLQCHTALFRPLERSAGGQLLSGNKRPTIMEKKQRKLG